MKQFSRWALFCFLLGSILVSLFFRMLLWDDQGNLIAHSYPIWGDWSAHFTFISAFQERGWSWIFGDSPLFAGAPFQYPFLSHAFSAGVHEIGSRFGIWEAHSPVAASMFTTAILLLVLPWLLFRFFRAMPLQPAESFMGLLIFLFFGGLQFLNSNRDANQAFTHSSGQPLFTNFLFFELIPQRAFLFGLITFLLAATALMNRSSRSRFVASAAVIATLICLHVHTWIATAVALICWWLVPANPHHRKPIFKFGLATAAFSSIPLKLFLFRESIPESSRIQWEWWAPGSFSPDSGSVSFWLYHTGIFLPLALVGWFQIRHSRALRPWGLAGAVLMILATLFQFQPSPYDNLKIYTYSILFLVPGVVRLIRPTFDRSWSIPVGVVGIALLIGSGLGDAVFFWNQRQTATLFTDAEFSMANRWREIRDSPESVVLISPRHNHWVPCLTGSPVAMGYPGWLWSWGIQYREREIWVHQMMAGNPDAFQKIETRGVRYAVFHQNDRYPKDGSQFPVNLDYFRKNHRLIFEASGWAAFDLKTKSP